MLDEILIIGLLLQLDPRVFNTLSACVCSFVGPRETVHSLQLQVANILRQPHENVWKSTEHLNSTLFICTHLSTNILFLDGPHLLTSHIHNQGKMEYIFSGLVIIVECTTHECLNHRTLEMWYTLKILVYLFLVINLLSMGLFSNLIYGVSVIWSPPSSILLAPVAVQHVPSTRSWEKHSIKKSTIIDSESYNSFRQ